MANVREITSELRNQMEKLYGERLVQVILFGSHARGDAQLSSDIDVLVVLKGDVNPGKEINRTIYIVSELSLQYDTVISCVFISHDRYLSERSPLLINVRKEGVTIDA